MSMMVMLLIPEQPSETRARTRTLPEQHRDWGASARTDVEEVGLEVEEDGVLWRGERDRRRRLAATVAAELSQRGAPRDPHPIAADHAQAAAQLASETRRRRAGSDCPGCWCRKQGWSAVSKRNLMDSCFESCTYLAERQVIIQI